eukprot:Nitzschia sp. Nitz4//scaffold88_size82704//13028//13900//NITZ4_005283-RA/size82704-processed-gene-0.64-mRNA-1//-1//CDS//3329559467//3091//frame0
MGRVAKYKKIKSCDPYSKKNGGNVDLSTVGVWGLGDNGRKAKKRSRRSEQLRKQKKRKDTSGSDGFDLPPSQKDEFDIKDLVGSLKKQVTKVKPENDVQVEKFKVQGNVASIPKTDQDEKKLARTLKLDTQVKKEEQKKVAVSNARMEGESKRAYAKRTKTETRQIIQRSATVNHEKRQKKKEFLNSKKKKRTLGDLYANQPDKDNNERDWSDEDEPEEVPFGEQAERPPIFRQIPRGAKAKKDSKQTAGGMSEEAVQAEKAAMELMRRKVQAQYAAIKTQRRRAGDFHL